MEASKHGGKGEGKTEGAAEVPQERGANYSVSPRQARGMGAITAKSGQDENEPFGFGGVDSGERYLARCNSRRKRLGGILRQLKLIKEAHLSYVNAHTERLKARLAEDDLHRRKVIDDIDLLERQIEQLIEEE